MRRQLVAVAVLSFSFVVAAPAKHSAAAVASHPTPASFAPVIVELFPVVHPKVGQRDAVIVRFVNNNRPVAGAHLSARLQLGKRTLRTVRGSTTDHKGNARAAFTVPQAARGKTLRVLVSLSYKGRAYRGRNDISVQK